MESALLTVPTQTTVISNFYRVNLDADRLRLHVAMFHDCLRGLNKRVNSFGDIVDILIKIGDYVKASASRTTQSRQFD